MRSLLHRAIYLLLAGGCLLWLVGCSGTGKVTTGQQPPTPTPTAGPGQQLLSQSAQLLNSAHTLHGLFAITISGQLMNGELDSEIWRMAPDRSRTQVQKSTLSQFAAGLIEVNDGKQVWQYDPQTSIVYTGPASATNSTQATPVLGANANQNGDAQQLILGLMLSIFEHSVAILDSSTTTVNGQQVYIIHVSPQSQNSGGATGGLNYDGTVTLAKQTRLPIALNLTIQGFGQVQLNISQLVLNSTLASTLFTFTPPPDAVVKPFPSGNTGSDGGSLTLQQAEQQAGYHLLSIPTTQTAYKLQSIDALGAPGSQIYTLTYSSGNQTVTISEGKALANLPISGQSVNLRATTGTVATSDNTTTLSWTEKGVGVQLSGALSKAQALALAQSLS